MKAIRILLLAAFAGVAIGCDNNQYVLPEESVAPEQFVVYNNKVDILLMVDNSSSMSLYQNRLAAQAPALIAMLNKLGLDYHIATVSTDMNSNMAGRFWGTPRYLTAATANLEALLLQRIQIGQTGSSLERGIEGIAAALSPAYLSAEGQGFLRDDAMLAIIALTNEDDHSASGATTNLALQLDQLRPNFESGAKGWVVNFIGIPDLDSVCKTEDSDIYKEAGIEWMKLVSVSGGLIEPICKTSLDQSVLNIGTRIVSYLTDFHLGREPALDTIRVYINGLLVPQNNVNGWEYIAEGYVIRFHGTAVPAAYDKMKIDFTPAAPK